ncbi:MAG: hypothetical protein AUJ47_06940 [Candidatus Marinimicrobia bacterium CG1_02_48_14]|nr:MAG: hypothetical protein AUJ47_06940 [Candidatus Marinimicrobia bacterium CG1_02_48_14]
MSNKITAVTDLDIYQMAEKFSDRVWNLVLQFSTFERDTLGKNLVRAADSISLNIAEGFGRFSYRDSLRFSIIARGSFEETKAALRKCFRRGLISREDLKLFAEEIDSFGPKLNAFIGKQRQFVENSHEIHETVTPEYDHTMNKASNFYAEFEIAGTIA